MSLDKSAVERVAVLARLALDDRQVAACQSELNGILDLVERLQGASVTGVEPLSHPLDIVARLRPDLVTESDQRALFQSIAPAVDSGLYLVPRVIE
ncbi:MAG: Asp-tRNA(Asn)/Glu-tRNA(Gln) amidotransferase subunit GatC [Gammaproteobacteria bacterium]|nr:Asp-tRNA(Asn)/Glu-tRNA(Gln) amidotransferase subunit GatC [Gammaproteobacteria bacterium]